MDFSKSKYFKIFSDILKNILFGFKNKLCGGTKSIALKQSDLDRKLVLSLSKSRIPNFSQLKYLKKYLSRKEKAIIGLCFLVIIISSIFLGGRFYVTHLQDVPVRGGTYVEGLVGAPKYLNPLYSSINDVDNDISSLIYSSLFRRGKDGSLIKDLVESHEISEDGKAYIITIRNDVLWHNGKKLTARDVVFTFNTIKAKEFDSPWRSSLIGVSIEEMGENKIKFLLDDSYAAFLELLTFGIMPYEVWSQVLPESAKLASYTVGSGPFKMLNAVYDESGKVREYNLGVNEAYYNNPPKIDLSFRFFPTYEEAVQALNGGEINGLNYLPKELSGQIVVPKTFNFHILPLSELSIIFFNQEQNDALKEKRVRQALNSALDKDNIVNNLLTENAKIAYGPILPTSFAYDNNALKKYSYNKEEAARLLEEAGWKTVKISEEDVEKAGGDLAGDDGILKEKAKNILEIGAGSWRMKDGKYLRIRLTSVDRIDNIQVTDLVKKYWEEIGVRTEIEIIPAGQIQGDIIKKRLFEALFYGQVLGADPDPYVFWHSTQSQENGFNLAGFKNDDVDELLEEARVKNNPDERREKYVKFQEIISEEAPVVFMYSPLYSYIQTKEVKGFGVENIFYPKDRFANINEWYMKTGKKIIW